jgi:anthranilate synthase component II
MPIVLIDNYDSFTWNLVHFLGDLGARDVEVVRNDAATPEEIMAMGPRALVLSPGPGGPEDAGVCLEVVARAAAARVPLLGVCLGHQVIGRAFGAQVVRAPAPVHGRVDAVTHGGRGVFAGLPSPLEVTRYHSLVVEGPPPELEVTARAGDLIMGLQHRDLPIHGVQFHPESIATAHGHALLRTFLEIAG